VDFGTQVPKFWRKMWAWGPSEMSVPVNQTTQHKETLKCRYLSIKLHSMRTLRNVGSCQPNYTAWGNSEMLVPVNQTTRHQSQRSAIFIDGAVRTSHSGIGVVKCYLAFGLSESSRNTLRALV
jgi:hypothetical protein